MDISDIVNQLKKEFLETFPEKIILIKQSISNKDLHTLEMEFHKFKGIGSTYGMPEITEMGLHIEKLLKNKNKNSLEAANIGVEILNLIQINGYDNSKANLASLIDKIKLYHL
jgi:HPt (histidine-containing phosphotransfer) domain-containing protein